MTKLKLNEKYLKDHTLGEIILQLSYSAKHLSSISKNLEDCFVVNIDSNEPIMDPFLAKNLVIAFESDPTIRPYFSVDKISQLKKYIISECDKITNSFEARLRPFCENNKIALEGRFPRYFVSGFLEVSVEQSKGICRIGGKSIKSLMLESIVPTIFDILKNEAERPFEITKFKEELFEAYERVIKLKGINNGQPVQVLDIFDELVFVKQSTTFKKNPIKTNYYEYTREYLARDLAKISSSPSTSGKRLELMPTAFPHEDGLPIRIGESVRYVGRLAFKEVNDK